MSEACAPPARPGLADLPPRAQRDDIYPYLRERRLAVIAAREAAKAASRMAGENGRAPYVGNIGKSANPAKVERPTKPGRAVKKA